jgi:hypothetical protein
LQNVFKASLPQMALKQIGHISLMILDRVFKVPCDWLKALTPIIIWMTLHIEDNLVQNLFDLVPELNQELSRIHQLVSKYVTEQYQMQ